MLFPSFATFKVSLYIHDYAGILDAPRFQTIPARTDTRTVYDAWHGVNWTTRAGLGIKRSRHCVGCGAVLRQENRLWLDMPSLRCTAERGYNVFVVGIAAQYVNVSSSTLPVVGLYFVAFDRHFDRLHGCSNFDYYVKGAIFESRAEYSCG